MKLLLFPGYLIVLLLLFPKQPLLDPGVFWHVRSGEWVLQHGGFPPTDPFSWSYADQRWIPQQWAAECLMAILHRIGGYDLLLLAMMTLLAGLATWITNRWLRTGVSPFLAIGFVALAMDAASYHFYLRPHLFTLVFMAIVMGWIVDDDRHQMGIRRWLWFIPLVILWTNLHGGVLGGIATVAIAWTGLLAYRMMFRHQGETPTGFGWRALIFLAAVLATLVNPFGWEMHRTWWSIVGSRMVPLMIDEHTPLTLSREGDRVVLGFGVFYLLMLGSTLPKRPRVAWLIPLVWLALSVQTIRHGSIFCVMATIAMADFFPETVFYRILKKYGNTLIQPPVTSRSNGKAFLVGGLVVISIAGLQLLRLPIPVLGSGWAKFDTKLVPMEMIEPIQEYASTRPDGFPIFNDANFGGFLIYYTPTLRIYMDDRCELYGDAGLEAYAELMSEHPEVIETLADNNGFDRALVVNGSPMDSYLAKSPRWQEVAHCQRAILYRRLP